MPLVCMVAQQFFVNEPASEPGKVGFEVWGGGGQESMFNDQLSNHYFRDLRTYYLIEISFVDYNVDFAKIRKLECL